MLASIKVRQGKESDMPLQYGSIIQVKQKSGTIWRFRYRDGESHRSEYLGTLEQLPTLKDAQAKAAKYIDIINGPKSDVITIADLIERYQEKALSERASTANSYRSILKRIKDEFGDQRIDHFVINVAQAQEWLDGLVVIGRHPKTGMPKLAANTYRSQVRNVLHVLFEKAQLWRVTPVGRNPISLISVKDAGKRRKELTILEIEQYDALLNDPKLPLLVKTIMQVCVSLGLRISEALGLRWEALDFENGVLKVECSVVQGETNDPKTMKSKRELPLHPELATILMEWRKASLPVNGWVFGSERTGLPYGRDYLRDEYLIPAGERIGLISLGWHSLRHTYRAMLRKAKATPEQQRDLMGHSKITTTMDVYGGKEKVDELRPANAAVIDILTRRVS